MFFKKLDLMFYLYGRVRIEVDSNIIYKKTSKFNKIDVREHIL